MRNENWANTFALKYIETEIIQGVEIAVDVLDKDVNNSVTSFKVIDSFSFTYTTAANWPAEEIMLTGSRSNPFTESR